jgi:SAM-dependent methyltransferase
MNPRWFEGFFEGIALEVWRRAISPEDTRREVDFLASALNLQHGARILDVPCGLGRHSLELASRGFRPTAVDFSAAMISEARSAAAAAHLGIDWRHADMRELPWTAEFDAGFCLGNSFGYLDPAGTKEFLAAASRSLKPGARFVLDYGMSAESILPRFRAREWTPIDDILFLEENHYLMAESCIETTYSFLRDGKTETRTGLHWVFTIREIRALLREAGFEPLALFSSTDREPFVVGSPVLILVAEKA